MSQPNSNVINVANLSDINLNELLGKIENIALKNTKTRESLDLLKQLYRIAINYYTFNKNKSSNSNTSNSKKSKSKSNSSSSSATTLISSLKVNPIFIEKLTTVLIDPNTPYKVKLLSLSIIAKISVDEPQLLHKNLKTFENKVLSLLLSLLLTNASEESASLLVGNIPLIVQSISMQDPVLRPFSMPSLLICARYFNDSISNSQIKSIETQLSQYLSHASLVSDQKQSSTGFFKIGASTGASPVTELDGSVSIEFFTVLNNAQVYTEDQSFNIYSFSLLYTWLTNLYNPNNNNNNNNNSGNKLNSESPPVTPRQIDSNNNDQQQQQQQRVLNSNFQSTIVSYCLRIIDQSKLKPPGTDTKIDSIDNLSVIALLESIRILDFLCCCDVNLVPKIFPTVQKAYQLHLPSSRTTNANSGHVLLSLLQFFVNHSHTLIYDPEPLFRAYFQTYLPRTSWSPQSYIGEFSELLPSLVSPSTFVEVFHLLLDLPLLTSSMESVLVEQRKFASMGSVDVGDVNDTAWSEYRVLYNYLLRNESGLVTEGRLASDIVQSLVWIIGEYASQSICPEISSAVFNDYHEALELLTYEKINLIKMESLSGASQSSLTLGTANPRDMISATSSSALLTGASSMSSTNSSTAAATTTSSNMPLESITMMLVLISSLTKIASRWPEATSRVILCLLKVLSYHQYFDIQVVSRANECISLLKFPSFTTAVYDCAPPSNKDIYTKPISHDNHSALSFLLHDPTKEYPTNNSIHPYILTQTQQQSIVSTSTTSSTLQSSNLSV
ncbi:hypothetical protein PPL_02099 [Heterostelium album PN500]|uniref:Uncharacterized protein n=1 Tax=Heterostelium pallidum (strain ATCC 26659 / Pp 5 / PN500) TaxID=670386 RepID=D3B1C8_HETP5|nr:hypothetical protein PPL_02099 [Heterostelium album PN500]EFA85102.1 hypothetical protein PPL_02099 [Heterostelium album PN500]|eukprot:XP_020437211.1 hypothetical protein PPL_02099 [Heterostelium album PN500]